MHRPYDRYTDEERAIVREMALSGRTQREAAKALGCPQSSINWIAQQGNITFKGRSAIRSTHTPPPTSTNARRRNNLEQWKARNRRFEETQP